MSRQAVAKWEAGLSYPELETTVSMAALFGVRIDTLLNAFDDPFCHEQERDRINPDFIYECLDFLCRAKRATYAGKGPAGPSTRPGSHDLSYCEGELFYHDTYLGGEQFSGQEGLWLSGEPLWAMNYSGRILGEGFSGDFLKQALLQVCPSKPFRGPQFFQEEHNLYISNNSGDLYWFQGHEEIFHAGNLVYECVFHGGTIV